MAYDNLNTQQMNQGPWGESQSNVYDDLYPLELNHENISLFNTTHNGQFQQPQQPQQQIPYNGFSLEEQSQYTISPDSNNIKYDSDSLNHNGGFDANLGHGLNISDESSPIGKNQIPSPETSSSSAGTDNLGHSSKKQKSKRQLLDEQDAILIARDDSELNDDELQLKRKAQNRAAQRAFRERKETKLKELEAKLLQSEDERQQLMEQLDLIRKQNISIQTENQVLRSKPTTNDFNNVRGSSENKFTFPQTQSDFIDALVGDNSSHEVNEGSINKVYENSGKKILAIGAVWDYLQIKAEEYDIDLYNLDVNLIMSKLRGHEKCHGYGPAYPLELVQKVFAETVGINQ